MQPTVNPENTEALLSARKYKTRTVRGLKLFEKEIQVSKEAKYLGVVLVSKLNWSRHLGETREERSLSPIETEGEPSEQREGWDQIKSVGCTRQYCAHDWYMGSLYDGHVSS